MHKTTVKQKILLVIFGLILSLVIIEISLRIAGFIYLALQEQRNRISLHQKGQYRILCLGDSNTALGGENSYPRQLEHILNQRMPGMQFSVINKGIPGVNTTDIVSQLKYNLDTYKPHMVIVMMGINDNDNPGVFKTEIVFSRIKNFIKNLRLYNLGRLLRIMIWKISNPHKIYLRIGRYYQWDERYSEAEEMFKKAIALAPDKERYLSYLELGWCYSDQGKYLHADEMFKKARELAPNNVMSYIDLGWCYEEQGKYLYAEEMFKKAREINPKVEIVYLELGRYYQEHQRNPEAEEMFKKAIKLAPNNVMPYIGLGWCYNDQGKYFYAEEMFKKAREINRKTADITYLRHTEGYYARREYSQAEKVFKDVIEIIRKIDYYNNKITRYNYQKLRDMVLLKGAKLVSVQYPIRSLEPLKTMFDSVKGITFIDNERVFKEALKNGKYEDYFIDRYGGDFGHCASNGNRLLADNIAQVILKEYFNK